MAVVAPALRAQLSELSELHRRAARVDPNAFLTYVLRSEDVALPLVQSRWHMEWQALASRYPRLILWSHVESGKTSQLSIGRALWELGRNPGLRILVLSNTNDQAMKIATTIGRYIEESVELHAVFPELRRDKTMPWTRNQLYVKRPGKAKDPSVRSLGIHGNILGGRVDLLIVDDILDYENTLTPAQREDLDRWFKATLEGRLTRNARVWMVGNAWHIDDLMHRYAKSPVWHAVRYPVVSASGTPTWPESWPQERIDAKRQVLGSIEFSRQMMCVARSDEQARFKQDWIRRSLDNGNGRRLAYGLQTIPDGYRTYTGVDLGVRERRSTKRQPDLTVMFTIVVHPNGSREVLDVDSGRWAGPEIVSRIIDKHHRYHSIVLVENNAAQDYILQFTRAASAVPVQAFTTGRNKYHMEFGIEGIATEMANGKWIIPNEGGAMHPEVEAWVNDLLYYDPAAHPGDRLMASWFAREGARQVKPKIQFGKLDILSR